MMTIWCIKRDAPVESQIVEGKWMEPQSQKYKDRTKLTLSADIKKAKATEIGKRLEKADKRMENFLCHESSLRPHLNYCYRED